MPLRRLPIILAFGGAASAALLTADCANAARPKLPQCPRVAPAPPLAAPCLEVYLDRRQPAASPTSGGGQIFCHSFYAISYSTAKRDPVWTSYRLTADMSERSDKFRRRSRTFGRQAGLGVSQQPRHKDWIHPPFARGHMTPDNDAPTCEAQADTYWVTNIIPQNARFNSGLWSKLEGGIHRLAIVEGEIFIVTGPLFEDSRPPMNGIQVPSHVFKAIYVPSRQVAIAFVSTNEFPTDCRIVSIANLERRVGFDPFPSLPASAKATLPQKPSNWTGLPAGCRASGP